MPDIRRLLTDAADETGPVFGDFQVELAVAATTERHRDIDRNSDTVNVCTFGLGADSVVAAAVLALGDMVNGQNRGTPQAKRSQDDLTELSGIFVLFKV